MEKILIFSTENLKADILVKLKAEVEAEITLFCSQPPNVMRLLVILQPFSAAFHCWASRSIASKLLCVLMVFASGNSLVISHLYGAGQKCLA